MDHILNLVLYDKTLNRRYIIRAKDRKRTTYTHAVFKSSFFI